jgi:site-specific recombinase XerD
LQRASDLMALGHYSELTRKHYLQELRFLFTYYPDIRPSQISYEMTVNYLVYLVKTLGCSRVKCKMAAQSFAFFFKHVLNKPYSTPAILFPAHEHKLPAVMTQDEIRSVINAVKNIKHRMLLSLMYSTGMRLSEIANLKIDEVDSKQMRIRITSGKGKKDRYVPLSVMILNELRYYYIQYRPEKFLFNGAGKGRKYAPRTIQHILQFALAKAGLQNKNYSIHTIRHSFATHLIDNGTDLQAIQQLMGHQHINQTLQYLHLSTTRLKKIVNPYDALLQQQQP